MSTLISSLLSNVTILTSFTGWIKKLNWDWGNGDRREIFLFVFLSQPLKIMCFDKLMLYQKHVSSILDAVILGQWVLIHLTARLRVTHSEWLFRAEGESCSLLDQMLAFRRQPNFCGWQLWKFNFGGMGPLMINKRTLCLSSS